MSLFNDEEIEAAVDRAFLKLYGKTYREPPPREGDTLDQIVKDYPELFEKR